MTRWRIGCGRGRCAGRGLWFEPSRLRAPFFIECGRLKLRRPKQCRVLPTDCLIIPLLTRLGENTAVAFA